jgi:hypothetical protein
VGRLCGGVDNRVGLHRLDEAEHRVTITNVELVMRKRFKRLLRARLIPPRVALPTEEHGPLVVVDSMHMHTERVQMLGDLTADQTRRAR